MTHQFPAGLGAQFVVHTLNQLVHLSTKPVVTDAIISAIRHLRFAVGLSEGPNGLERFDDELMHRFNRNKSMPDTLPLSFTDNGAEKQAHWTDPRRITAILKDSIDNCLLLNARGNLTSTETLLEILTSYLVAINKKDASLGDLLLDLNSPEIFQPQPRHLWQSLYLH